MKTIFFTTLLMMSSFTLAKDFSGKLICSPSAMTESGIFRGVKISNPEENVNTGFFGEVIEVDLKDASEAKTTAIRKELTSDRFDGVIDLGISFSYQGEIAAGNLVGVNTSLTHRNENWFGNRVVHAKSSARSPILSNGTVISTELFSQSDDLIVIKLECYVSPNSIEITE